MTKEPDFFLTPAEMERVNKRLAQRTAGRVSIGPEPVLNSQARAIWEATAVFRTRRSDQGAPRRRHNPAMGFAIAAAAASLSGCTFLNPNVKGSFNCRAPNGTCSPTTSIDDRALADIASGAPGAAQPIGTYDTLAPEPHYQKASTKLVAAKRSPVAVSPTGTAEPVRSSERVLRIVFPAHVDSYGRFVEASAVHTVVEQGAWLPADPTAAAPAPVRLSERPSLTDFASAAPELTFADLDGSRGDEAAANDQAYLASASPSPRPSGASTRLLPPGAPQLAQRSPGGTFSNQPVASVRGQLQSLKPIVVPSASESQAATTGPKTAVAGQAALPSSFQQRTAIDLYPVAANQPAGEASPEAAPTEQSARPPLMQTAPATAGAAVQAGVAAKLQEAKAAAIAAAKGALAADQPANAPVHFSAAGVDQ